MKYFYMDNGVAVATTTTASTIWFMPKHTVQIPYFAQTEIYDWVRANATKGFMLGSTAGGHPMVQFIDDGDYAYFLLKWIDYVVRKI